MNKNQVRIHRKARKLNKTGRDFSCSVPGGGYHNSEHPTMVTRTVPACRYVHKAKAKPFPRVNEDTALSMAEQRRIYLGLPQEN